MCCSPFGFLDFGTFLADVKCTGTESHFMDCRTYEQVAEEQGKTCQRNYAAVACFSGTVPTDYTLSLASADSYIGHLTVTYLGIQGSVCFDEWGDREAYVACRELGYPRGIAYNAARTILGPYWMSNISCSGTETRLSDCQTIEIGKVSGCKNRLSHAGVICYNNNGVFYRLGGSNETRYGRVEVSMFGDWQSVCNVHWDNEDAHVLCRMLQFQTGEAYQGSFVPALSGAVWEANIDCLGGESSLNQCRSSGWVAATSSACARHELDAGAFCYTSVKLSTGVGRETNKGAVLLYYGDQWNLVCSDGFNDTSAAVVCRELGFVDGHAQCCNQYGALDYTLLTTHRVLCSGGETDVRDCLQPQQCHNDNYASVVCYGFSLHTSTDAPLSEKIKQGFDALPVIIAVLVFVVLSSIAVTIFCLYRRRKRNKKREESKLEFDNTIVQEHMDSSLHAVNPLHGMPTPEVARASYSRRGNTEVANIVQGASNQDYDRPDRFKIHKTTSEQLQEGTRHNYGGHNSGTNEDPHTHHDKLRRSEKRDYVTLSHFSSDPKTYQFDTGKSPIHEWTNDWSDTNGYERIRNSRMIEATSNQGTTASSGDQSGGILPGVTEPRDRSLELSEQREVSSPTDSVF